jgi:hypothetical protein
MAVLAIITGEGITQQMYDILRTEVDWANQQPQGAIIHIATFDGSTAHVADVWESEGELNDFMQTRLAPVMLKHNYPIPQVVIYPVHNIDAYASVSEMVR